LGSYTEKSEDYRRKITILYIMSQCARPYCEKIARSRCSDCHRDRYCSGECQKSDWKDHKLICSTLKSLSCDPQPYHQVVDVIKAFLREAANVRVLDHLLCYAEFQFGKPTASKDYRERGDTEKIDNWSVDMKNMIPIFEKLIDIHRENKSLTLINYDSITSPLFEKMVEILNPWLCLDLNLDKSQMDYILWVLSQTEGNLSIFHGHRNQFARAESCCQRALSYARQYNEEGEKKTTLLQASLSNYCNLYGSQGDFTNATTFAEEAYNVVAVAYNPVHPQVYIYKVVYICICIYICTYMYIEYIYIYIYSPRFRQLLLHLLNVFLIRET
jgi:tetratricopeptide (TPR) repeat protein